jgi:hypothetical protein
MPDLDATALTRTIPVPTLTLLHNILLRLYPSYQLVDMVTKNLDCFTCTLEKYT